METSRNLFIKKGFDCRPPAPAGQPLCSSLCPTLICLLVQVVSIFQDS